MAVVPAQYKPRFLSERTRRWLSLAAFCLTFTVIGYVTIPLFFMAVRWIGEVITLLVTQ